MVRIAQNTEAGAVQQTQKVAATNKAQNTGNTGGVTLDNQAGVSAASLKGLGPQIKLAEVTMAPKLNASVAAQAVGAQVAVSTIHMADDEKKATDANATPAPKGEAD